MANLTLFIPDILKTRMKAHSDIRWSRTIVTIIENKLNALDETNKILKNSTLTEKDVDELTKSARQDAREYIATLLK